MSVSFGGAAQGGEDAPEPPVWAPTWRAPTSDAAAATAPAPSRASRRPDGFGVALVMFFALELVAALLRHTDELLASPASGEAVVGYAMCLGLAVGCLLVRGRVRAVALVVTALAGAALPVWLSRGLLRTIPPRDLWIGQSLTLEVLFPVVVGFAAAVMAWRRRGGVVPPP